MKMFILVLLVFVEACSLHGANPGDEVVVVYNSRIPLSKAVAEYYAEQRLVPRSQVFGFDMTSSEDISRAEFREALQKPLAKALSAKKLWRTASPIRKSQNGQPDRVDLPVVESKIRYAVL